MEGWIHVKFFLSHYEIFQTLRVLQMTYARNYLYLNNIQQYQILRLTSDIYPVGITTLLLLHFRIKIHF